MFFFRITKRKQLEKGRVKSRCGDEGAEEKEEKWVLQWRTEWQWTCERERASVEVVCSFSGAGSKAPERTPGIYRGRVECVKNMFFRFNGNTHLHGANPIVGERFSIVWFSMEAKWLGKQLYPVYPGCFVAATQAAVLLVDPALGREWLPARATNGHPCTN